MKHTYIRHTYMYSKGDNILIISPHIDDGELGAGGSMMYFIERGCNVHYVALAAPHGVTPETAIEQCKRACKILSPKISISFYIDIFSTRTFYKERQILLDLLITKKDQLSPKLVFTPASTDFHQDHKVVHEETVRAFKNSASILGYDFPWDYTNFDANFFIPITKEYLDKKVKALKQYTYEYKRCKALHKDTVEALAHIRGTQYNTNYAEAFEFIRGGYNE